MAWEAVAQCGLTPVHRSQMSSADCSYSNSPAVNSPTFLIYLFQRSVTWPLTMNPSRGVPTSFRHDLEWVVQGFLVRSHRRFFGPDLQRKAGIAHPVLPTLPVAAGGRRAGCKWPFPSLEEVAALPLQVWRAPATPLLRAEGPSLEESAEAILAWAAQDAVLGIPELPFSSLVLWGSSE